MCRGEVKGDSLAEVLNPSCCFATAAAAIQVGQVMSGQ